MIVKVEMEEGYVIIDGVTRTYTLNSPVKITKDNKDAYFSGSLLLFGQMPEFNGQNYFLLNKLDLFKGDSMEQRIFFNKRAFICNDNNKTIEVIQEVRY